MLLSSCAGEKRPAQAPDTIVVGNEKPAPAAEPEALPKVKGVIVWSRPEDADQATSYWLDPEGNVLKQEPGIFLLADGKQWQFSTAKGRMPVFECEAVMAGTPAEPTDYKESVVPSLIEDRTHRGWDLWEQPSPGPEERYADYSQSVTLVASAGRYLVLGDHTWVYGCGAHGFGVASYTAYDLQKKEKVSLLSDAETYALKGHELARAVAAFKAAGDGFDEPREEQVTLINAVPEVTSEGQQRVQLVFSIGACYACSHGEGSSYTATTRVVAEGLPRALAEQPLPRAVAVFAASHAISGWTAQ